MRNTNIEINVTTVTVMTDMVTELQKVVKTSDEDRKAADVERIRRENKAKLLRKERDIAEKKTRKDERQADKKERYKEEKKRKEKQTRK